MKGSLIFTDIKKGNTTQVLIVHEILLENNVVELCPKCQGRGWNWSDLTFGDIPGDEVKKACQVCNSTGRVKTVTVRADVLVPLDWTVQ